MSLLSDVVIKLEKFSGSGKILFDNEVEAQVDFTMDILRNGRIIGTLNFESTDHKIISHFTNMKYFILKGRLVENGGDLVAKDCLFTTLDSFCIIGNNTKKLSTAGFSANAVTISAEALALRYCYSINAAN